MPVQGRSGISALPLYEVVEGNRCRNWQVPQGKRQDANMGSGRGLRAQGVGYFFFPADSAPMSARESTIDDRVILAFGQSFAAACISFFRSASDILTVTLTMRLSTCTRFHALRLKGYVSIVNLGMQWVF